MTWETLWAVGRHDLRLTDEEFWSLVPRQFVALMRQLNQARVRQEYGPAMIVAAILGRGLKRPPDPTSFMPSYKKPKRKLEEVNWEAKMTTMRASLAGLGGR